MLKLLLDKKEFMMKKQIPLSFTIIIVLIWSLPALSTDIYLPSMPSMAKYFDTTLSEIQYTIFFYTAGFSIGALFFGPMSDRFGRKPIILISLVIAAISALFTTFSTSLTILFFARLVQGIALAGVGSTMRAVTKDICPDKESMATFGAILGIAIPIANAVAPIIGGYIESYLNWRVSFGVVLIYTIVFLLYAYFKLPETNHERLESSIKNLLHDYKDVITNKVFFRYNAITAFALCSLYAYLTISPKILQVKVGLTPEQFGYSNLLVSISLILSSYINSKLLPTHGIDNMLRFGAKMLGVSGVIFLIIGIFSWYNLYIILFALFILVFGCGFIFPTASAGGLSLFATRAGTAGAIYGCIQMLGGSAGSAFITLITREHFDPLIGLGLFIIIQSLIGTILGSQLIKLNNSHSM
ncbi:MAG: multidrug effflux MFS transporter [Burkholderiales bacterium]|nr:multidrug effflux MFS transporter [Burkholderiales bacterium]